MKVSLLSSKENVIFLSTPSEPLICAVNKLLVSFSMTCPIAEVVAEPVGPQSVPFRAILEPELAYQTAARVPVN